MAKTDFNSSERATVRVWSLSAWKHARNSSFIQPFVGKSGNSMIQRVSELTKTKKGWQAIIRLIHTLKGDGTAGDNQLEGREEAINYAEQTVRIDQLRHANRHMGKMTEQKTVDNFREESRDLLGYWLGDICDQMAILALSGIGFGFTNKGGARDAASELSVLEFAGDVKAPTVNRHRRWDATLGLLAGDTTAVAAVDKMTYECIVRLKAYAETHKIAGIKTGMNKEVYHAFLTPSGFADLRLDSNYQSAMRNAGVRGKKNEIFAGEDSVLIDGVWIHKHRHIFDTTAAVSGSKWGAGGAIDGGRMLFCGSQALGIADLDSDAPEWNEQGFDYANQQGISIGKMFGFLKPQFESPVTNTVEDFGVICVDHAVSA